MIGFDIAIDDSDRTEAERKFQMVWCGDRQFYKDPIKHGIMILED